MNYKELKIGEENINTQGLKMKIINYKNKRDLDVEFEDGYIAYHKEYKNFKKGNIQNRNYRNGRQSKSIEETFKYYKIEKEKDIKRLADKYKDKIPKKLYDAMYKYTIEIDD